MGTPKITGFLIALVVVSFIAGVMGLFIQSLAQNYGQVDRSANLTTFNKLDDIQSNVQEYQNKTDIESQTGVLDIIGDYFSGGYTALKLTYNSFDLFNAMTDDALSQAPVDENIGTLFRTMVGLIVLILIVIGILVAAIVKRDL